MKTNNYLSTEYLFTIHSVHRETSKTQLRTNVNPFNIASAYLTPSAIPPTSTIVSPSLGFLSICRILIGGSSLLSPTFTASAASYPYQPSTSSSISYRLFGSRELVLGSCLWFTNSNSSSSELLAPLQLIGAIVDSIDIVATGGCVLLEGNLSPFVITITAGGAGLAIAIHLFAWRELSQKRGRKVQ